MRSNKWLHQQSFGMRLISFFVGISHASVLISCVGKTMTILTFFKLSFVLLWTVRKSFIIQSNVCPGKILSLWDGSRQFYVKNSKYKNDFYKEQVNTSEI